MANVQGVVHEVKVQETSVGTMYNLVVDGQMYGAGKVQPNVRPGDVVQFESAQRGRYSNVVPGTLRAVSGGAPVPAPRQGGYQGGARTGRPAPSRGSSDFGKNQEVISRQAARNSAIAMLAQLVALDAVPVAKSAKPGDKFDAIVAIVDKLTEKYFNHSQGNDASEPAAKEAEPVDTPDEDLWT